MDQREQGLAEISRPMEIKMWEGGLLPMTECQSLIS